MYYRPMLVSVTTVLPNHVSERDCSTTEPCELAWLYFPPHSPVSQWIHVSCCCLLHCDVTLNSSWTCWLESTQPKQENGNHIRQTTDCKRFITHTPFLHSLYPFFTLSTNHRQQQANHLKNFTNSAPTDALNQLPNAGIWLFLGTCVSNISRPLMPQV